MSPSSKCLGGRFDSTNVCRPRVSIIATVGLDHTAQLGNTVEEIAFQKAGIIKRGVPVVCGVQEPAARRVIETVSREVSAEIRTPSDAMTYRLGLLGRHQIENAKLVVATVEELNAQGFSIPPAALAVGLANLRWPGRIELVSRNPHVVLDCAHNVPSASALAETLESDWPVRGKRALVFAVSSDKDYPAMLRILAPRFDHFYLTKYGINPRCVPLEKLAEVLRDVAPGKAFSLHETSHEAWAAARATATPDDLICITGSVFLAGELQADVRRSASTFS